MTIQGLIGTDRVKYLTIHSSFQLLFFPALSLPPAIHGALLQGDHSGSVHLYFHLWNKTFWSFCKFRSRYRHRLGWYQTHSFIRKKRQNRSASGAKGKRRKACGAPNTLCVQCGSSQPADSPGNKRWERFQEHNYSFAGKLLPWTIGLLLEIYAQRKYTADPYGSLEDASVHISWLPLENTTRTVAIYCFYGTTTALK